MKNKLGIELDVNKRWELGIDHHPKSKELYEFIEDLDFKNGDVFGFKSGGDGDNGEDLMYLMDIYFEIEDKKQNNLKPDKNIKVPKYVYISEGYNPDKCNKLNGRK